MSEIARNHPTGKLSACQQQQKKQSDCCVSLLLCVRSFLQSMQLKLKLHSLHSFQCFGLPQGAVMTADMPDTVAPVRCLYLFHTLQSNAPVGG